MSKTQILDRNKGISFITTSFLDQVKHTNNRGKWLRPPPGHKAASRSDPVPSSNQPWHQRYKLGTRVSKVFGDGRECRGKVVAYDDDHGLYSISYEDGDSEDMDDADLQQHAKSPFADNDDEYGPTMLTGALPGGTMGGGNALRMCSGESK